MKGSKEFDNILDECLERLLEGETIEQCFQSYPEQAAELEPLLRMALAVREASTIQPSAEFKARARYQFRSALQEMESKKSHWFFGWQPRWATVVTVVLILLLAGSGTVAAAGNSMPDSPLYPVKLATEQVRLTLNPSALGKAELYTKLADKRVAEIIYMASKGDSERVELVTRRLNTHLAKVAVLAAVQNGGGGVMLAPTPAPEPADEVPAVLAPAPVPRQVEEAPEALTPTPTPERAGEDTKDGHPQLNRRDKIRDIVRHHAINHPARLRALLETAPESVKPALLRAVNESVTGYNEALKALAPTPVPERAGEGTRGVRPQTSE